MKKKVLWLINDMTKQFAEYLGISGGDISWVTSTLDELNKCNSVELYVVFPQSRIQEILKRDIDNAHYYGVYQDKIHPWELNSSVEIQFKQILEEIQPDVIHIWGTEYSHSLDMCNAVGERKKDRIVVHIQGLISVYAQQYMSDLPFGVKYGFTLRDLLRKDNIREQQLKFYKRGKNEIALLNSVKHVMGRTDWDRAHSLRINSQLSYHFCNESMRKAFFEHVWDIKQAKKYSIFITQGYYPIKGFHYFLEALTIIVKEFPQIKVRIAGENIMSTSKRKIRESSYNRYIRKYIEKNNLSEYIEFLGYQDVDGMVREYLRANVFVLPSALENSPNSLAEALVVGVPTVVSDVGGVSSMVEHGKDAFLYQHNDPTMLAYYIAKLFKEEEGAQEMSVIARNNARKQYDAKENVQELLKIYDAIIKDDGLH